MRSKKLSRHMPSRFARATLAIAAVAVVVIASPSLAADGVFVRFKLLQPQGTSYYVRLGGYIHESPWYLPKAIIPDGTDKEPTKRVAAGEWTPWFDLARHAGNLLHGRMSRSGGVAEWPNITADFITSNEDDRRSVVIELATGMSSSGLRSPSAANRRVSSFPPGSPRTPTIWKRLPR